jgi:hypothetical protein
LAGWQVAGCLGLQVGRLQVAGWHHHREEGGVRQKPIAQTSLIITGVTQSAFVAFGRAVRFD